MKRSLRVILVSIVALVALLALVACGTTSTSSDSNSENKVIKIGASPTPHAEILAQVKDVLAEEGYTLEVVEYTDYIIPNTATEDGEILANYFQHLPYLEDFNAENGTHLVSVAAIHFEPLGLYPGKTASVEALQDGAQIAIPNDTTNEARALLLLQDIGLLTLADGVGLAATPNDIVDNPKNITFVEVEAAAVPRSLGDVDLAVINGNYALSAGLSAEDQLASEGTDSLAAQTYANIIVVKEGNENDERVQALIKALQSDKVRTFIESEYGGAVVAVF
ncbi:MAG: ABC transporter substrate-binding protein [Actinobacteria bacterium]|nr:ABC transporter substrate-binding protein [Actinomycetota bacterium]